MEYKHTTPAFVELIRKRTEEAYDDNEPVKLSPVMLSAYIKEFEEMEIELAKRAARIAELETEVAYQKDMKLFWMEKDAI